MDETWIHTYSLGTKLQSQHWCFEGQPPPLKAKVFPSAGKVMATVFWDTEGIVLIDYLPKGQTITSEYYASLLTNDVRNALRRKRSGKLSRKPLLLQGNARPHTAKLTTTTLRDLGCDILPHPPYSPDLAPSDYHLFGEMKSALRAGPC